MSAAGIDLENEETTMTDRHKGVRHPRTRRAAVAMLAAIAAMLASASVAQGFEVLDFDGRTSNPAGDLLTQAGAHADAKVLIDLSTTVDTHGRPMPDGNIKDLRVDLPPGFIGNPTATPTCPERLLRYHPQFGSQYSSCSDEAQVGTVRLKIAASGWGTQSLAVYNLERPTGIPGLFGFNFLGVIVKIQAELRDGGRTVSVASVRTSQALPLVGLETTFWGVPADDSHDAQRGIAGFACDDGTFTPCKSDAPEVALLSLPTDCDAGPLTTSLQVNSWQEPLVVRSAAFLSHDDSGAPVGVSGCDRLGFVPSMGVGVEGSAADGPTGLKVDLALPQNGNPDGLSTAHLRNVDVTLPEGVSINPAAADGLAACTDAQLGLGTNDPIGCPAGSRIGSVVAETPLLEEPVEGSVFVMSQASDDPASGEMFRTAIVLEDPERGVIVKLLGGVKASPSGQLTASFLDNPQLPVSSISVRLKGGARAPLALPADCGEKSVQASLTSWAGQTVELRDSFTVECPGSAEFEPGFAAGSSNPIGAAFSPFVARIEREQRQRYLSGVTVDLPQGLLAKLAGVQLCPDGVAGDGTPGVCPAGSRIGTATVGAGSGNPFYLSGPVYLTGPYRGAPYGLSVQVPAKAGPFDLGMVKVRQRIDVDPETADISIASDPLPQIVKGVPVRLRNVNVDIDRPSFTINPTSCGEKRIDATLTAIDGQVRNRSQRFQVADCSTLAFKPKLSMRLTGRGQTRTGDHPALSATLRQPKGQANTDMAKVTLPRSIALDAVNSSEPKLICDYDKSMKADCPASTVIGKATARTPVLNRPLTGDVHLVQGIRFGPKGNRIRTTPSLLVKLRGEVAINLRARTNAKSGRLVTTFPQIPDAPISRFIMKINGGNNGILVVTENRQGRINLCNQKQTALVKTDGHNGKRADYPVRVKTPCAKTRKRG